MRANLHSNLKCTLNFRFHNISRHKSLIDYFQRSGFNESFDSLKKEAGQENFVIDAKARYVGLLEKKWTGVVRLQKRVSLALGHD